MGASAVQPGTTQIYTKDVGEGWLDLNGRMGFGIGDNDLMMIGMMKTMILSVCV